MGRSHYIYAQVSEITLIFYQKYQIFTFFIFFLLFFSAEMLEWYFSLPPCRIR